jgi:hypothetical protein
VPPLLLRRGIKTAKLKSAPLLLRRGAEHKTVPLLWRRGVCINSPTEGSLYFLLPRSVVTDT